jgi:outer membrane murein-binding lipoprotein Lpp
MRRTFGLVAVAMTMLATAGCSTGGNSCSDLADQIATLESPATAVDPSWDSVKATAERSIERDLLRAQMTELNCG